MARERETVRPDQMRVVTLVRGRHRWSFRCAAGLERELVAEAARMALRNESGLDLADAAILARRLDAWPAGAGGGNGAAKND